MPRIRWRREPVVRLLKAIALLCTMAFLLAAFMPSPEPCYREQLLHPVPLGANRNAANNGLNRSSSAFGSRHRLAVIVPFRDRFTELLTFAPHIHQYLNHQNIEHHIYVINQIDDLRFNRASLINIGYLLSHGDCDYMAMHDVDLLPVTAGLNYTWPRDWLFHVAGPQLHPKYSYDTFIGGILIVNSNHFKLVNGMSNKYYGWGMEDDEFYVRVLEMDLQVKRPTHIKTGKRTFRHVHNKVERPRDYKQYGQQAKVARRRDRETGVDSVDFELKYMSQLNIEGAPVTFVGVELNCDITLTPWCMRPEQLQKYAETPPLSNSQQVAPEEEKRLEGVKNAVLKLQEEISQFRKSVKPVRQVKPEELPRWMKNAMRTDDVMLMRPR